MMVETTQASVTWKKRLGRAVPVLALTSLALLALSETVAVHFQSGPPADETTWMATAAYVRSHFQKGDLLVFVPGWIDPVGRKHLGDLLTLDQVSRPDTDTYRRIWVVGLARHEAPFPYRRRPRLSMKRRFGKLRVRLFEQDPVSSVYDFYEHVPQALVDLTDAGGNVVEKCPWRPARRRHQCRAGWNNVRRKLAEIDYHLRRCIYAHPHEGLTLRISYPDARLGSKLVVYTGLDNYASRYRARKAVLNAKKKSPTSPRTRLVDVTMKVYSNDRLLGKIRQPVDEAWHRHVLDTPGGRSPVRFEITSQNVYGKVFCFFARAER